MKAKKPPVRKPRTPKAPSPELEAAIVRLLAEELPRRFIVADVFGTIVNELIGNRDQCQWDMLRKHVAALAVMTEVLALSGWKPRGKVVNPS